MQSVILNTRPLNDDIACIADAGKVFKGNLVAAVEYYTYLNPWNDKQHYRGFKTIEALQKWVAKRYPEFDGELYQ